MENCNGIKYSSISSKNSSGSSGVCCEEEESQLNNCFLGGPWKAAGAECKRKRGAVETGTSHNRVSWQEEGGRGGKEVEYEDYTDEALEHYYDHVCCDVSMCEDGVKEGRSDGGNDTWTEEREVDGRRNGKNENAKEMNKKYVRCLQGMTTELYKVTLMNEVRGGCEREENGKMRGEIWEGGRWKMGGMWDERRWKDEGVWKEGRWKDGGRGREEGKIEGGRRETKE